VNLTYHLHWLWLSSTDSGSADVLAELSTTTGPKDEGDDVIHGYSSGSEAQPTDGPLCSPARSQTGKLLSGVSDPPSPQCVSKS